MPPSCSTSPPGPGETGARICETFPEIRARQIAYWDNHIKKFAECPWPTVLLDRDPTTADDYDSGFRNGQVWHNTDTGATFVAEAVWPAGGAIWNQISAGSGSVIWTRLSGTIAASATITVDSIALVSVKSVRYIITLYNEANSVTQLSEVGVVNEGGSLKDSRFSKVSNIQAPVALVANAGNLENQITNNEAFTLNYDIVRATFG